MKLKLIFAISCASIFGACAHVPTHYASPDSTALRNSSGVLIEKVTEARATTARASAAVGSARESLGRETVLLDSLGPDMDKMMIVAPASLKPQIEAIKTEMDALRADHEESVGHVDTAQKEQAAATGQLEQANAAKNEVEKLSPVYFGEVDKLATKANAAEAGWAKDSKNLQWYRIHFWLSWIIAGAGVLVCLLVAFLKFTGRLTLSAAAAAAKV